MKTKLLILVLLSVCLNSFAGDGSLRRFANPVRDRYIVVLRSDIDAHAVPQIAKRLSAEHGGKLRLAMNNSINMFSVEMTERQAIAISHHPLVDWVEEVGLVYTSSLQTLPPPTMQWMNLWNLDRVDQYATQGSGTYQFCEKAADVIAYMVDTGVKGDHQEFVDPSTGQSRVKEGARWAQDGGFGNEICPSNGGTTAGLSMDTKLFVSHGTATASVLGGKNVGVAKGVTIVPLRIASCDPYWLQGAVSNTERLCWALDWIRSAANTDRFHRPALISLSTYAQPTDGLITALEAVINRLVLDGTTFDGQPWSGIPVIASANNHARSDNNTSPARLAYRNRPTIAFPGFASQARVISVGGSGTRVVNGVLRDVKWQCPMYQGEPCWSENYAGITVPEYGSNHGNSVDIYAPAHNVETA